MKSIWKWLLLFIVLIGIFLRFYQLGNNPASLTWDEVAWGYNAYSLGIDGKDEFGRFLPHDYLESFGDFKPPMYAYLDIVPIKAFGLNEFGTRFPSAFFGVLTIVATYFLVIEIFGEESQALALLSSLFLAISPWHINLSRAAFEANISSFFIVAGVWFFMAFVRGKRFFLPLSVAAFTLSLYTFNTGRVVAPLLLILLSICFKNILLKNKKIFFIAFFTGLILLLPTLKFLLSPQANLRFREVNIFSDPSIVATSNLEIQNDNNAFWSKILHNRRLEYGVSFVKHYFDNLNPSFLFIKGDGNPKFSTQDVGQMYLWDMPFFLLGCFLLFRKKKGYWWIIPLWLLIGIIPAGTARETPHALRTETTLPTFQIITAFGCLWFLGLFKKVWTRKIIIGALGFLLFLNLIYYLHGYYKHYPRIYSGEWQYGYKESIRYVQTVQSKYERINITNELGRPYIYYLFYTKTDPTLFRREANVQRDTFGFVDVASVGKYYFDKDPNSLKNIKGKTLYINTAGALPKNANILKTFYLLNGSPVLFAYTL